MRDETEVNDKINVLFLHSQEGFGADSAIHGHLMRYLDRDRFVVHLACSPGDGSRPSTALARFNEIPGILLRPTKFAPGFHHRSPRDIARGALAAVAFPLDPKSVVHVHVGWSEIYSAPAKWAVRNADAVFGISRFVTEKVVATGTPRERVHTVLNGIDPSRWDPDIDGSAIRREFGVPGDAPLLASVSRLFGYKGQRELLRALARVRREVADVWLLIVGADVPELHAGSFTEELKTLARELQVSDRVVFTGERSDIPPIMAACDVFSLPSFEEPFGLVYLEAMAMRRPVVAVHSGGTPEVVEQGLSGLLSPVNDVDALASNIVTLLQDPALRARMGAYGRSRVLAYFNAQRMARDAGEAYKAILAS
jgi:glycosyltransferase involved in cell wall biosynthesis